MGGALLAFIMIASVIIGVHKFVQGVYHLFKKKWATGLYETVIGVTALGAVFFIYGFICLVALYVGETGILPDSFF